MSICLGLLGLFGIELLDHIELNELLEFLALPDCFELDLPVGLEPLEFLELLGALVFNTFLFC